MLNLLQTEIYVGIFLIYMYANNRACNRGTPQAKRLLAYYFNDWVKVPGGGGGGGSVICWYHVCSCVKKC